MKIFLALGTQKFQFDRLVKALDEIASRNPEMEIFAQTGGSTYVPQHMQYQAFIERDVFLDHIDKADIVIVHGGTAAITSALKAGKRVLAVPRKAEFGEHVDDHQEEICQAMEEAGYLCVCRDIKNLEADMKRTEAFEPKTFISNTENVLNAIREIINS